MWVQKLLNNLEHTDESTLEWNWPELNLVAKVSVCLLLLWARELGQSAFVSLAWRLRMCCCYCLAGWRLWK